MSRNQSGNQRWVVSATGKTANIPLYNPNQFYGQTGHNQPNREETHYSNAQNQPHYQQTSEMNPKPQMTYEGDSGWGTWNNDEWEDVTDPVNTGLQAQQYQQNAWNTQPMGVGMPGPTQFHQPQIQEQIPQQLQIPPIHGSASNQTQMQQIQPQIFKSINPNDSEQGNFPTPDGSWNWSMDDAHSGANFRDQSLDVYINKQGETAKDLPKRNDSLEEATDTATTSSSSSFRQICDDNKLTPQWSIESQVSSHDSSDNFPPYLQEQFGKARKPVRQNTLVRQVSINQEQTIGNPATNYNVQAEIAEVSQAIENLTMQTIGYENHEVPNIHTPLNYVENKSAINYETLPDNVEQPDQGPMPSVADPIQNDFVNQNIPNINSRQWFVENTVENFEIAPRNDRNQYLETGQFGDEDGKAHDTSATEPPLGLSRMVLGQNIAGQNDGRILTGLDRVVDGESETQAVNVMNQTTLAQSVPSNPSSFILRSNGKADDLPPGLHRMIPGESSSPDSRTSRYYGATSDKTTNQNVSRRLDDVEPSTNVQTNQPKRSETIGGDTIDSAPPRKALDVEADSSAVNLTNLSQLSSSNTSIRHQTDGENTADKADDEGKESDAETNVKERDDKRREYRKSPERFDRRSKSPNQERPYRRSKSPTDLSETEPRRYRKRRSPGRYDDRHRGYESPAFDEYKKDKYRYRDRHYEDDTDDYYSDRGRSDYDKRVVDSRGYSSLRRDPKDRNPRRRDRYSNDYYRAYDDDDDVNGSSRGSRPPSRNDDSYHAHSRNRDRAAYEYRKTHRDQYPPYNTYGGYDYTSHYTAAQYQYYDNLRRTNPEAYAELYKKFYGGDLPRQSAHTTQSVSERHHFDDTTSVHSGRSSAHGSQYVKDEPEGKTAEIQRLTPVKFSSTHVNASIQCGFFVRVPVVDLYDQSFDRSVESANSIVEICNIQSILDKDPVYHELVEYPGPLIKGVTHKKTVMDYCEAKIRGIEEVQVGLDRSGYVLLWKLLLLLLKQNGVVEGSDVAELLLKSRDVNSYAQNSRRNSVVSSMNSEDQVVSIGQDVDDHSTSLASNKSTKDGNSTREGGVSFNEKLVSDKFREFLLYGSTREALEYAIKRGLWGQAFLLASTKDKQTQTYVMVRYANTMAMNDPLQTFYQLRFGKQPASVTCLADEKWGDWRPHLSIILSNASTKPEVDRTAITTLGDTLSARGLVYSAQFCYLMAQMPFGKYGTDTKLVLLGSTASGKSFKEFATNDAIAMTEIYEYARRLHDPTFVIPEFQVYKYLLSLRLVERGFFERALLHLEHLSGEIVKMPHLYQSLSRSVVSLAERLQAYNPKHVFENIHLHGEIGVSDGHEVENTQPRNWLDPLRAVDSTFDTNANVVLNQANHSNINSETINSEAGPTVGTNQTSQQSIAFFTPESGNYNTPENQGIVLNHSVDGTGLNGPTTFNYGSFNSTANYAGYDDSAQVPQTQATYFQPDVNQQAAQSYDSWNNYETHGQISLPNSAVNDSNEDFKAEQRNLGSANRTPSSLEPKTTANKKDGATNKQSNSGWFGGLWNKLSLKPKNQMILPDDKNPTIVWDSEKKRWVNLDESGNKEESNFAPPPKMAQMSQQVITPNTPNPMPQPEIPRMTMPNQTDGGVGTNAGVAFSYQQQHDGLEIPTQVQPQIQPQPAMFSKNTPTNNVFSAAKGKGLRRGYVDIFAQNGAKSPNPLPNANFMPMNNASPANYYDVNQNPGPNQSSHNDNTMNMYPNQYSN